MLMLAAAFTLALPAVAAADGPQTTTVHEFSDGSEVPGASAQLVRTGSGISATIKTYVPAGDAITIWVVAFNQSGECWDATDWTDDPPEGADGCGEDDVFGHDGLGANGEDCSETGAFPCNGAAVIGINGPLAGHVVGGSGNANFGGRLAVGDTSKTFAGAPVLEPKTGEFHLIVRTHGTMIPAEMPAQIHSIDGGCGPDLGPPCADLQFAEFKP
jgi:hypothetical protein